MYARVPDDSAGQPPRFRGNFGGILRHKTRPLIVRAPRQPNHATSSPGGDTAGPEMINDRPLLVAGVAMCPLFRRSSSIVS